MDPLWIAVAFILGFAVKQIGLPPMVGFLAAGFVLHSLGEEGGDTLDYLADFGVHLLLFSIFIINHLFDHLTLRIIFMVHGQAVNVKQR